MCGSIIVLPCAEFITDICYYAMVGLAALIEFEGIRRAALAY